MRASLLPLACTLTLYTACGDGLETGPNPDASGPADGGSTPDAGNPDAGGPDAGNPDASIFPDAQLPDGAVPGCDPSGTYVETDDAGNDAIHGGDIETTGLIINGLLKSIGGCIDPQYADSGDPPVADADVYSVTVATGNFVSGRIFSPQGTASDGGLVIIVDGQLQVIGGAELVDGEGLLSPVYLPAGQYAIAVYHPGTALANVYEYSIELMAYACNPQTDPAIYTENRDGATSRGNDVMAASWNPDLTLGPTAAVDAAEPTATTVVTNPAARRRFDGVSADISSAGDDYLDRDTFLFRTGSAVRRIIVVVDWIGGGNNLDLVVLPEGSFNAAEAVAAGVGSGGSLERAGGLVTPASRYWLWVGNAAGASPPASGVYYRATICGYL